MNVPVTMSGDMTLLTSKISYNIALSLSLRVNPAGQQEDSVMEFIL